MAEGDRFEPEHRAVGRLVHRDKHVGKRFQLLMLVPGLLFALMTAAGLTVELSAGAPAAAVAATALGGMLLTGMFAFGWATLTVLRTVVTDREVVVQCGWWEPHVELDRILSCEVKTQSNRVRVGVRPEGGMITTSFLMRLGEHVEIVYTNSDGDPRRVVFTPDDPRAVVAAIERARAGEGGRQRVGASAGDGEATDGEAADDEAEASGRRSLGR